ncbi:unnamed protein product [Gadus morhua 'NCC']
MSFQGPRPPPRIATVQESLDLTPLPHASVEFLKMPKHPCMACGSEIALPLLSHHIKFCNKDEPDLADDDDDDTTNDDAGYAAADDDAAADAAYAAADDDAAADAAYAAADDDAAADAAYAAADDAAADDAAYAADNDDSATEDQTDDVIAMQSCPICGQDFAVDFLPIHAAGCNERPEEPLPSTSTQPQIQGRPEGVQDRAEGVDDSAWRNIADVRMAADVYRQALLLAKEDERILRVKLDMAEDEEDREGQIINFYKAPNIDWARPFQAKLQGDIAIGDGVTRHFLSLVIHKLEHGFRINVGNSFGTMLFEGQSGHLVPSNSKVFVQNDMYIMAGRMIGHAFLHSGPRLTGLSPAVKHVLAGGTPQTATITLEDITDIDVRETLGPLHEVCEKNGNLTSLSLEQKDAINTLAIEMDYPILKEANRSWLLHNILQDVVFGRIKKQLKQLKEGLKETNVLNWMEARPDAVKEVFPSQAEATCSPEVVLELIQWPQEVEGQEQNRIKEFLLQFIRTAPCCT